MQQEQCTLGWPRPKISANELSLGQVGGSQNGPKAATQCGLNLVMSVGLVGLGLMSIWLKWVYAKSNHKESEMVARTLSGGGITSNKYTTSRSGVKVEPVSKAANVAGVAQQGMATAFKKEPLIQGRGYEPAPMPATGVKGNYNSAPQGPGSQRTVYQHGSQAEYGPVNRGQVNRAPDPPATRPGRDILSDYGPEMKRGR